MGHTTVNTRGAIIELRTLIKHVFDCVQSEQHNWVLFSLPLATAYWSLIEPAVEILSACLPCMTPILKLSRYLSKVRPSLLKGVRSSKRSQDSSATHQQGFRQIGDSKGDPSKDPVYNKYGVRIGVGADRQQSNWSEGSDRVALHSLQ